MTPTNNTLKQSPKELQGLIEELIETHKIQKHINDLQASQKSIKELKIRLNNKLQAPSLKDFGSLKKGIKEIAARFFSCPENEAKEILKKLEKECKKLKKCKEKLEESIQKAEDSIEKRGKELSKKDPSKCLREIGEKDYKLTDNLKDLGQEIKGKTKGFFSKLNPFKK